MRVIDCHFPGELGRAGEITEDGPCRLGCLQGEGDLIAVENRRAGCSEVQVRAKVGEGDVTDKPWRGAGADVELGRELKLEGFGIRGAGCSGGRLLQVKRQLPPSSRRKKEATLANEVLIKGEGSTGAAHPHEVLGGRNEEAGLNPDRAGGNLPCPVVRRRRGAGWNQHEQKLVLRGARRQTKIDLNEARRLDRDKARKASSGFREWTDAFGPVLGQIRNDGSKRQVFRQQPEMFSGSRERRGLFRAGMDRFRYDRVEITGRKQCVGGVFQDRDGGLHPEKVPDRFGRRSGRGCKSVQQVKQLLNERIHRTSIPTMR